MFSYVSVILFTGGRVAGEGACVAGGCAWQGGLCGVGACMARVVRGGGGGRAW